MIYTSNTSKTPNIHSRTILLSSVLFASRSKGEAICAHQSTLFPNRLSSIFPAPILANRAMLHLAAMLIFSPSSTQARVKFFSSIFRAITRSSSTVPPGSKINSLTPAFMVLR